MENLLEAKNPVLFYHNGVGDRLLALPTLRAIASLFPGRLKLVCAKGDRELFYSDLDVAGVYEIDIRRGDSEWTFDPAAVAAAVGECDLLVCPTQWFSDDIAELIARFPAAETVGFFRAFGHRCHFDDHTKHAADGTFEILRLLDPSLRAEDFVWPVRLPRENVEDARRLRAQVPPPFRVMVVQADSGWENGWPAERFVSVLDKFLARHPNYVAFVVDKEDFGLSAGKFGANVIPLAGLPTVTAWALVNEADLYFGIDSFLVHVADLAGTPSVGLFGPAWPDRWKEFGFRFGPNRQVSLYDADEASEDAVLSALESIVADTQRALAKTA